jgi:hypothetical protein
MKIWSEEKRRAWQTVKESMSNLKAIDDNIAALLRGEAASFGQSQEVIRGRIRSERRNMLKATVDLTGHLLRFHELEE